MDVLTRSAGLPSTNKERDPQEQRAIPHFQHGSVRRSRRRRHSEVFENCGIAQCKQKAKQTNKQEIQCVIILRIF